MRAGDDLRKRTLRMALAAVKQTEIDKGIVMDEAGLTAILHKEIKSRREAIADAQKANRPDLSSAAEQEIAVLEEFLPKMLSAEELEAIARQVIAEVGAASPKEMGLVMKTLLPRVQGRAAGDVVGQTVKRLLTN